MAMYNRRTREDVKAIIDNSNYKFLDEYMTEKSKRRVIIQDKIGYKYDVAFSNINRKNVGFSFVDTSNPYSLENISLWLKLNDKDFVLCENNIYIRCNVKLKFYHSYCDEFFYASWDTISQGTDCAVCDGRQIGKRNTLAYLRPDLSKEYLYSENNKTSYEVTSSCTENVYWCCSDCEWKWWATINNRNQGRGCPKCAEKLNESKVSTECKKYFKHSYNSVSEYKLFKNPETNQWLKCDIYIPNNIFVEIHGHQHYRFSARFYKNKEEFEYRQHLDKIKKEYCQKNGLYIEVDLRKIKTSKDAVEYIENIINSV